MLFYVPATVGDECMQKRFQHMKITYSVKLTWAVYLVAKPRGSALNGITLAAWEVSTQYRPRFWTVPFPGLVLNRTTTRDLA